RTADPNLRLIIENVLSEFERWWYRARKTSFCASNMCHKRRHASDLPVPRLLLLNGMYGAAPAASIAVRLSFDRYALSADSSLTLNPRATDDARSGASITESPTVLSVASTEAITFVTVPTCAWSLIQRWHFFSVPYFSSNHRA